jgi:hypothetical protein
LKEKSKKINITKDITKVRIEVLKDIILAFLSLNVIFKKLEAILVFILFVITVDELLQNKEINIVPNKGINNKDKSNICLKDLYLPQLTLFELKNLNLKV